VHAAARFGFTINAATPAALAPDPALIDWSRANNVAFNITRDPREAVKGADVVITDCWVSMGDKDEDFRRQTLAPYQVNTTLMGEAAKNAIFMHCLPAHRGEEVTDDVIDGPQSVVFDEAENRLHAQKAVLAWCLAPDFAG
jgi:ornithine carbamoyltransferase